MDKSRYWVSVGNLEILPQGEGANHEFEIEATEAEITYLKELLDQLVSEDTQLLGRAKSPYEKLPEDDQDVKNISYDMQLKEIYRLIYELGSSETKAHLHETNMNL
ncbi:hydrolase [Paenibacillus eucommiae]|uniref:Hydrolase/acyltransferase n=1 Tax=Paenibacillus eucommiae TaxID=1355755 RepID=A0ABS4JB58_9BACL|nr:hydrolase [Paenibacillus eucommiae]MBP1997077.1 hypothetical protein [Paenibacillus eucommiae]